MTNEADLNEYTKTLRALLWQAFKAGHDVGLAGGLPRQGFTEWITSHSDERADAARRFLDAAAKEGYV